MEKESFKNAFIQLTRGLYTKEASELVDKLYEAIFKTQEPLKNEAVSNAKKAEKIDRK